MESVRTRTWAAAIAPIALASILQVVGPDPGGSAVTARALIRRAGNAEADLDRLEALKQLRDLPGIDVRLRTDAERLVAEIDRWVHSNQLGYFGRQVLDTLDYDFQLAEDSPLHPLARFYRGRMLTWAVLEHGGVNKDPALRRRYFDKARADLQAAAAAFPRNRIARMYLGEPIPARKQYAAAPGAPEWAVYQRESLERIADIAEWWIDNRVQPDGSYGGGWGDDCEMWRWQVPALIAFDDPKLTAAQTRFSAALLAQPHMKDGYTSRMSDVEHTAEDTADVLTPMMHLEPENQDWVRRALRIVELMEEKWTGVNERGFLQFKSTYFNAEGVDGSPARACDTVYHPRTIQPALLYWQRTGDKRMEKLVTRWMATWVDAAARSERGKPAGIMPSAIHWPDGRVGGLTDQWWNPGNHHQESLYLWPSALRQQMIPNTLLLSSHLTGDGSYLEPLRSMAEIRWKYLQHPPTEEPEPGSKDWCARQMDWLTETLAKFRMLTGEPEFDRFFEPGRDPYMDFRLHADRAALTLELRNVSRVLRSNFEGFTSEVRYTDRVLSFPAIFLEDFMFEQPIATFGLADLGLLYSTLTGDPGSVGYFPLNAVRWLTPPREIAALVTDSGARSFEAELFHFGERQRSLAAEFYLLEAGPYVLSLEAAGRELLRREFVSDGKRARVALELPPRQLCMIRVAAARGRP